MQNTEALLGYAEECSLLLFALCALTLLGGASGYGYIALLASPLAAITLIARLYRGDSPCAMGKSVLAYLVPFAPFLLAYLFIRTYYAGSGGDFVLDFDCVAGLIVLSSLCYAAVAPFKPLARPLFFAFCALASCLYTLDIAATAYSCGVNIWDAKNYVVPYSTTFGRTMMIPAGLAFLGYFVLQDEKPALRRFCLLSGVLGFVAALGFIAVRSVIPSIGLAFFCAALLALFRGRKKDLWAVAAGAFLMVFAIALGPLPQKLVLGYQESVTVLKNDAADKTLQNLLDKDKDKKTETAEDEALQKSLNNSMGGRFAVWNLAKIMLPKSPVVGFGDGRPASFVDIKELFKYSTDYLVHFHSDFVQSAMVGGLVLLLGLLLTEAWLLWQGLFDPLRLYLAGSVAFFGIFEIGFFETTVFSSFLGAWVLVSHENLRIALPFKKSR
jgi:hypothetical protein